MSSSDSSPPSTPTSASSSSSGGYERRRAERRKIQNMMFNHLLLVQAQNNPPQNQTQNKKKRRYVDRKRAEGHKQLYNDYFAEEPVYDDRLFRRRFRMRKHLFLRLVEGASTKTYFKHRHDALGKWGLTPLQKCTAAIRMLAYGESSNRVDEYVRLGDTTSKESLLNFVDVVITKFGGQYLRSPTVEDVQRILQINEARGFSGSLNDLNVLHRSPVFDHLLNGRAPRVNYWVNGQQYDTAYYLTDGIYPRWATFMPSIRNPQTHKDRLYSLRQESVRKDVEQAFGVLQARFAIIRRPALSWDETILQKIMTACIILHNMIVEDERDTYVGYDNANEYAEQQNEGTSQTTVEKPEYGI